MLPRSSVFSSHPLEQLERPLGPLGGEYCNRSTILSGARVSNDTRSARRAFTRRQRPPPGVGVSGVALDVTVAAANA